MQSRGGKLLPAARVSLLSLHIIRLASGRVQHRQDFVGGAEATGLQHGRLHRCERFELFARIGSAIRGLPLVAIRQRGRPRIMLSRESWR